MPGPVAAVAAAAAAAATAAADVGADADAAAAGVGEEPSFEGGVGGRQGKRPKRFFFP